MPEELDVSEDELDDDESENHGHEGNVASNSSIEEEWPNEEFYNIFSYLFSH